MHMKVSDEMKFKTSVKLSMLKELTVMEIPKNRLICFGNKNRPIFPLSKLPIFRPSQ